MSRGPNLNAKLSALTGPQKRSILEAEAGQIYTAHSTVEQQARRLGVSRSVTTVEHQADSILFIFALNMDRRLAAVALQTCEDAKKPPLQKSLAAFDRKVADQKDALDMLAHIDAYVAGMGNLQKSPADRFRLRFERRGTGYVVKVGLLRIDVRESAKLATDLAVATVLADYEPSRP